MFARLADNDRPAELSNAQYVDIDKGLLSILGRYDWTLSDRTGYATESAIDSTMLGELFERLILATDGPRLESDGHIKMPGGTYYTPQDVADEMVVDALSGWIENRIGDNISIHDLIHPAPQSRDWTKYTSAQVSKTLKLLEKVAVLDPCCGSGAFTVAVIQALWRARTRLQNDPTSGAQVLENIIETQVYAIDIHPLAVLITRLRIFIALVDLRPQGVKPLPNLETRVVAANTLCIDVASAPFFSASGLNPLLRQLGAVRESWTSAHSPSDKKAVLELEHEVREEIRNSSEGWIADSEFGWLENDLLSTSSAAATCDARLLFPKPDGWDIVVGNPPYQHPDKPDKALGKRLGYVGATSNLYVMFIEAALKIVRPGGCITLIVPHSVVFRRTPKSYSQVRSQIELASKHIDIRTYDNAPQPVFPNLPWLKKGMGVTNNQRVTILRAILAHDKGPNPKSAIYSRGMMRLTKNSRLQVLRSRNPAQLQPESAGQWTQAPTPEFAKLLAAMRGTSRHLGRGNLVTMSQTARYFIITCLPHGRLINKNRKTFQLADDKLYWPWIGLYNSHLFNAYWLIVGDHFHVTAHEYGSIRQPTGWLDEGLVERTKALAQELTSPEIIRLCRKDFVGRGGKIFPNCNFHGHPAGAKLIEQLDRLLLEAYGFETEPLLSQMRTIRIGSAHELFTNS